MRTIMKMLTVLGGGGVTYNAYVTSLQPLLWLKLQETSGTTAVNSGSLGSAQDGTWTPGVGAVGQTGLLGANEAYDFDGLDSRISVPATASINNLTTLTVAALVRADNAGENNQGHICTDNGNQRSFRVSNDVNRPLIGIVSTDATSATSITATNFLQTATWNWIFITYDNAGDRKVHFYKNVNSLVTEATYTTNTAATGNLANGSGVQWVGNRSDAARTFDGLYDEFMYFGRVLTSDEMQLIITRSQA